MAGKTLYDKLWQTHLVEQRDDGTALLQGLDDIALTLQRAERIREYELKRKRECPWLFEDLGV